MRMRGSFGEGNSPLLVSDTLYLKCKKFFYAIAASK